MGLALAVTVLFLLLPLTATAADLFVTNETHAFGLDTRLRSHPGSTNSMIVQAESATFTLDTQLAMEGVTAGLTTVRES